MAGKKFRGNKGARKSTKAGKSSRSKNEKIIGRAKKEYNKNTDKGTNTYKNIDSGADITTALSAVSARSATGIAELDSLLGGGFPKGAIVLVAGNSGTGKTLLAFEWLFNGVKKFNENGIYVTFTEPLFKTLKNLEGVEYFDRSIIENERIKILDIRKELGADIKEDRILDIIEAEVRKNNAQRLAIDSVTAVAYFLQKKPRIRSFIFNLGTMLATLGCTTMLTSEVAGKGYSVYGVEEFISDGIILLERDEVKFQPIRKLQIAKMRGISHISDTTSFKISSSGIKVYPRVSAELNYSSESSKISTGISGLDSMTKGGFFKGSSCLIAGSTGTGKSLMGLHFIVSALKRKEPCLLVSFEESRNQIIRNAKTFGWDLEKYEKDGLLDIICSYPSQKYIEEHMLDIKEDVKKINAKCCVIDSLSSMSNSFPKEEFRYFVKRLNGYLKSQMVTTIFTTATTSLTDVQKLTESHLSTMTDNIILLKYVELGGNMGQMVSVLKTRGDDHSKSLREYKITGSGIVVGEDFSGYEGVLTGTARKVSETTEERLEAEFRRFLGPIASSVFYELKNKGIDEESVLGYITSLSNEGILKKDDADIFISNVNAIFKRLGARSDLRDIKLDEYSSIHNKGTSSFDEKRQKRGIVDVIFRRRT